MDSPVGFKAFYYFSYPDSIILERTLKQTFSAESPDKIQKFIKNFKDLKGTFFTGINVQTAVLSQKVDDQLERIGQ